MNFPLKVNQRLALECCFAFPMYLHLNSFGMKLFSCLHSSTKPLLTLVEQIPMTLSPEMRRHNFDEVESRPGAIAKQRSSSKLNEVKADIYQIENGDC